MTVRNPFWERQPARTLTGGNGGKGMEKQVILTNQRPGGRFDASAVSPAVRRQNLINQARHAPSTGAFALRASAPALAGGRGNKGLRVTNNSACPWSGSEPPAASGAVRSLVVGALVNQEALQ